MFGGFSRIKTHPKSRMFALSLPRCCVAADTAAVAPCSWRPCVRATSPSAPKSQSPWMIGITGETESASLRSYLQSIEKSLFFIFSRARDSK